MSRGQIAAIGLIVLLAMFDGFDILSVTFAAPAITKAWGVGKSALGLVLSAGLVGMALGSFLLAPLGDKFGRKPVVLLSLALIAIGMFLSAYSASLQVLAAWRIVTGLGIGACISVTNPMAAEFANVRRRALAVAMVAVGYPAGGVLGGLGATFLLARHDWPALFAAGAIAAAMLLPLTMWLLPESPAFLLSRPRRERLRQLNAILAKWGMEPVTAADTHVRPERAGYGAIFARGCAGKTLWITAANFLFVGSVYFILSWLPQMIADAGFAPPVPSLLPALMSLVGIVGGVLLGWLSQRGRLRALTGGAMIAFGCSILAVGAIASSLPELTVAAALCGFFLYAGVSGSYAAVSTAYTDKARASGTGFVLGMGRVSSAIAPAFGGWLFARGLSAAAVSSIFGACAAVGGITLLAGWQRFHAQY